MFLSRVSLSKRQNKKRSSQKELLLFFLLIFLFHKSDCSDIIVFLHENICEFNFPNINILLCYFRASIRFSIPHLIYIITMKYQIPPSIKNKQIVFCYTNALYEEEIICSISIRSKCVWNKESKFRCNFN